MNCILIETVGIGSWIRGEKAKVAAEYKLTLDQHTKTCLLCLEDVEDLKQIPGCKHLFCDFCLSDSSNAELSENGTEVSFKIGEW